MDPTTGSVLISGLKALYDMAKANKSPEMMAQLLEIQAQVFNLVNDNQALKEENSNLKGRLAEKMECELRVDGAIWRKFDKATPTLGGFCPNCFSGNGKLIKLRTDPDHTDRPRHCSICKFSIEGQWW